MNEYCKYDKIAEWFDDHRNKELMEIEYLELALAHIPNKGSVLDLGCGTGEPIAKFFIEHGFHVTGIDGAIQMIALCKKRFPEMEWMTSDMRTINLDKKFNVVIAWDSFFHLNHEDQRNMFPIFAKHLLTDGILVFTSGPKYGEENSYMSGFKFYHASLSIKEYRKLLDIHGFKVLLNKVEDPDCGLHTVWVAKKLNREQQ